MGEEQAVKDEVLKYINPYMVNGVDIGGGGSPIFPQAINIDEQQFPSTVQWHGDARDLSFFRDGVLDYVFSSHCWEDFDSEEKPKILAEWVRVLKPDGYLFLLLPDEQRYRASCLKNNSKANPNHKDPDFGLEKTRLKIGRASCRERV